MGLSPFSNLSLNIHAICPLVGLTPTASGFRDQRVSGSALKSSLSPMCCHSEKCKAGFGLSGCFDFGTSGDLPQTQLGRHRSGLQRNYSLALERVVIVGLRYEAMRSPQEYDMVAR